ncbi:MAG: alpha/beta hydrolase [Pseudomonadota bacterium]
MKSALSMFAATASAIAMTSAAHADVQTPAEAPFKVERVIFLSEGQQVVGDLYIPVGVSAAAPGEAAVVTGAWTTIKEHMAGAYAAELAARGQIALAFDFRTWGESEGDTRSFENPALKIADIEAAGQFLASRPEVASVNGLGICASAGYMASAAEASDTFESIALVAPWLHDAQIVDEVYGGPEGVANLIDIGREAAAREAETGEPQLIPATGPEGSDALMPGAPYYTQEGLGLIPEWENSFNLASWEGWLTFDGVRTAPGIEEPVLIVHSDDAAIPDGSRRFYSALPGEKDELWIDGVSQFDFYARPDAVTAASDAAADFFTRN